MHETVEALEDQEVDKSCYLALLAEAYLQTDQLNDAAEAVAAGLNQANKIGEHYYTPELLRLRGEIETCRSQKDMAEASFREAITFAQRQGAKTWELKAARSLNRLLCSEGRSDEGDLELRSITDWFSSTEGNRLNSDEFESEPTV
jgi:predicted ATPase